MLQHGQRITKSAPPLRKKVYNPDLLTDEEDGYTQAEKERIDEELMNMPSEESLKLKDLLKIRKAA